MLLSIGCLNTESGSLPPNSENNSLVIKETESIEEEQPSEEMTNIEEESISEEVSASYEDIKPEELPGGEKALTHFLEDFSWFSGDYDCENSQNQHDLVLLILSLDNIIYDSVSLYSDYFSLAEVIDNYYHYDETEVDWLISNIYNFSDDDIIALKNQLSQVQSEKDENGNWIFLYYKDGEYMASPAGCGGGYIIEYKDIKTDGKLYQITYDTYWESEIDAVVSYDLLGTQYALMEYKIIDGNGYWSVYKVSDTNFFSDDY